MSLAKLAVTQWVFMSGANTLPDVVTVLYSMFYITANPIGNNLYYSVTA